RLPLGSPPRHLGPVAALPRVAPPAHEALPPRRTPDPAAAPPLPPLRPLLVPVLFIGFAGVLNVPADALENPDQVLPYMLTNLLPVSGWLFGLIGAGTLAAAMSSADAITHGAAVEPTRDVILPFAPALTER